MDTNHCYNVTFDTYVFSNLHLVLIDVDHPLICLSPQNDFINPSSLFIYFQRAPRAAKFLLIFGCTAICHTRNCQTKNL